MAELVRYSRTQQFCFGQIYWFHLMDETHVACTLATGDESFKNAIMSIFNLLQYRAEKKLQSFMGLIRREVAVAWTEITKGNGHAMKIHFGIRIEWKQNQPYHRMLIVRLHKKWTEFIFYYSSSKWSVFSGPITFSNFIFFYFFS